LTMAALITWIDHQQQQRHAPVSQPDSHDLDKAPSFQQTTADTTSP
jgi:hypothetical protein